MKCLAKSETFFSFVKKTLIDKKRIRELLAKCNPCQNNLPNGVFSILVELSQKGMGYKVRNYKVRNYKTSKLQNLKITKIEITKF